jgi:hypothetical protein
LMAILSLEGFNGKTLAALVYPDVKDPDDALARLHPFRSRKREKYQMEIQRVQSMSSDEREQLKKVATSELRNLVVS